MCVYDSSIDQCWWYLSARQGGQRWYDIEVKDHGVECAAAIVCWFGQCLQWWSSVAVETSCWCDQDNWWAPTSDDLSIPDTQPAATTSVSMSIMQMPLMWKLSLNHTHNVNNFTKIKTFKDWILTEWSHITKKTKHRHWSFLHLKTKKCQHVKMKILFQSNWLQITQHSERC